MSDLGAEPSLWMQVLGYLAPALGGAMLYAIGYESAKSLFDYLKDHGFGVWKKKPNLSGKNWYAAWSTTVEGESNINTETIEIKHRGDKLRIKNLEKSEQNKLGGYLWRAELRIFDNEHIIGTYMPIEQNVISKGSLYFLLNHSGDFLVGKWVGCNYDHEFTWGFGVIARDKEFAIRKLTKLLSRLNGFNDGPPNDEGGGNP